MTPRRDRTELTPADASRARAGRRATRRMWRRARRTAAASRGSLVGFLTASAPRVSRASSLAPRGVAGRFVTERLARTSGRRLMQAAGLEVCATYATALVWDVQVHAPGVSSRIFAQTMALLHDDPSRFDGIGDVVGALNTLRARERTRRTQRFDGSPALAAALGYHIVTTPGFAQVWLTQQRIDVLRHDTPNSDTQNNDSLNNTADEPDRDTVLSGETLREDLALELDARDQQSLAVLALRRQAEEAAVWDAVVAVSAANRLTTGELLTVALAANA